MKLIFAFPLSSEPILTSSKYKNIITVPTDIDRVVYLGSVIGLDFYNNAATNRIDPTSKSNFLYIKDKTNDIKVLNKKNIDLFDVSQGLSGNDVIKTKQHKSIKRYNYTYSDKIITNSSISKVIINQSDNILSFSDGSKIYDLCKLYNTELNPFKYFSSYIISNMHNKIDVEMMFVKGLNKYKKGVNYWIYIIADHVPDYIVFSFLKLTYQRGNVEIFLNKYGSICFSLLDGLLTILPSIPILDGKLKNMNDEQERILNQFDKAYSLNVKSRNRFCNPMNLLRKQLRDVDRFSNYENIITDLISLIFKPNGKTENGIEKITKISSLAFDKSILDISSKSFDTIENILKTDISKRIIYECSYVCKKNFKSKCRSFIADNDYFKKDAIGYFIDEYPFGSYALIFDRMIYL